VSAAIICAFKALVTFNALDESRVALVGTLGALEGVVGLAGSAGVKAVTGGTGVLAGGAVLSVDVESGGAGSDAVSVVNVLVSVAFNAVLKSAVAVLALAIDAGLALVVKGEETVEASVDAVFALEQLGGFALEAGVGAVAVEAVLLAVVAGHVGSEEGSNGALIMADVVVKEGGGSTLLAKSGVLLAISASVD
jgi:hypothetical protein